MPHTSGALRHTVTWAWYSAWFICFFATGFLTYRRPELRRGFRPPK
jgi:hypothetical protein